MPKKFDRCVKKVKQKENGIKNAYAICNSMMKKKKRKAKKKGK